MNVKLTEINVTPRELLELKAKQHGGGKGYQYACEDLAVMAKNVLAKAGVEVER